MWRGKPVFIKRRTEDEITKARNISLKELPHPEKDQKRVIVKSVAAILALFPILTGPIGTCITILV